MEYVVCEFCEGNCEPLDTVLWDKTRICKGCLQEERVKGIQIWAISRNDWGRYYYRFDWGYLEQPPAGFPIVSSYWLNIFGKDTYIVNLYAEGFAFIGGWTTAYTDATTTRKDKLNDFTRKLPVSFAIIPEGLTFYAVISPTSNPFSTSLEFVYAERDQDRIVSYLSDLGTSLEELKEWLA